MLQFFIGTLLVLSSLFLIALVLVQQGKGGGLAGAFGGMGGQSAFGTKAGDVFTRITIITALVWIFLCMLAIKLIGKDSKSLRNQDRIVPAPITAPATPGVPAAGTPGTGTPATGTPATGSPATGTPATTTPATPATSSTPATGSTPATTPDPMAPATTTPAPMTPATPESSTPAPATSSTPAPSTPEPSAPATPADK